MKFSKINFSFEYSFLKMNSLTCGRNRLEMLPTVRICLGRHQMKKNVRARGGYEIV